MYYKDVAMVPTKLLALWLFSVVYWGNAGGDYSPDWYNHWAGYDIRRCAEEGIIAIHKKRAVAFICQPADFPRPQPVAEPIERSEIG